MMIPISTEFYRKNDLKDKKKKKKKKGRVNKSDPTVCHRNFDKI